MILNFFKVAYRNIIRNKGFSAINITGLAVGMASSILILLWIQDEMSYDEFHENKDRIYEVWNRVPFDGIVRSWNTKPAPLARALENDIPEVERAVRVQSYDNELLFSVGDKRIIKEGNIVDTGFLQVFSFPLLKGNPFTALNDMHSVVLTEKMAKSLFGNEDAMGKVVRVNDKDNFTVTGILKDLPHNTRFSFDFLLPWSYIRYGEGQDLGWNDNSTATYVMLKPNTSLASVASKVKEIRFKYSEDAKRMK